MSLHVTDLCYLILIYFQIVPRHNARDASAQISITSASLNRTKTGTSSYYTEKRRTIDLNETVSNFQVVEIRKVDYKNVSQWARHAQMDAASTDFSILATFFAFNRAFNVHLFEKYSSVLSSDLIITISSSHNKRTIRRNDLDIVILAGYLVDQPLSTSVHGSLQKGQFDLVINTPGIIYFVESTSRYQDIRTDNSNTVVVYRNSDIRSSPLVNDSATDFLFPESVFRNSSTFRRFSEKNNDSKDSNKYSQIRNRRGSMLRNPVTKCGLCVVVDHTFYKNIGLMKTDKTVGEIVHHILEADLTFSTTDFNGDIEGDNIGFSLKKIDIIASVNVQNYYVRQTDLDAYTTLVRFSKYNFDDCCLGILFTFRDYGKVLGMSWASKPHEFGLIGGICQKRIEQSDTRYDIYPDMYNFNTLLITHLVSGRVINRNMVSHTVTHELGHSFGAEEHDDALLYKECVPADRKINGNYIMFSQAPNEHKLLRNNFRFSPCSRYFITQCVAYWGPNCLRSNSFPVCGNRIVEAGEECDCGNNQQCVISDPCCSPPIRVSGVDPRGGRGCVYRREHGSVCSAQTSPCCSSECKPFSASDAVVCREATDCTKRSVCNGASASCPLPQAKPQGSPCAQGQGECLANGTCSKSICTLNNFVDCQCVFSFTAMCKVCCRCDTIRSSVCLPAEWLGFPNVNILDVPLYGDSPFYMNPGSDCNGGTGLCSADNICVRKQ